MDEKDIEHRLTTLEDHDKNHSRRLEKLEETTNAISDLAASMKIMVVKQDTMNANITKLTTDVETLKAEPAKRWKFVVEKAIYFVVAAVVGFFLAKVGL